MSDTVVIDNIEVPLNEFIVDEETNERTMYTKAQTIPICQNHHFDAEHRCGRCPYMFLGFKSHLHIQREDGIYDRKTNKRIV